MYPIKLKELALYCKNKKNIGRIVQTSKDLFSLLKEETKFLHKDATNSERLWYVENDITEQIKCPKCNGPTGINLKTLKPKFCSIKCSRNSKSTQKKFKQTCLEKYGAENPFKSEIIKNQIKQTNLDRYGAENPFKSEIIKNQIKQTNLDRYGAENPFKSEIIKNQIKQTNLDRYGVKNVFQSDQIKQKSKKTKIEKYSDENYSNRKKYKSTCLERFGAKNPFQSKYIKNKIKQTNLDRHGVEYVAQSKKIQKKIKLTTIENYHKKFLKISNKIHNNRYKYFELKESHDLIDIECPEHGMFKQLMYVHMTGNGCQKCSNDKRKQTNLEKYGVENPRQSKIIQEKSKRTLSKNYHKRFLETSKNVHSNRYKYFELKESHDLIDIECPEHGIFQLPMYYHMNGTGCPKCFPNNNGFSQKAIEWLEYISEKENFYIQHAMNDSEYQIPGTRYKVDGYCAETNTCYEFFGDFWHGNLKSYKKDEINPVLNMTYGKIHEKTMARLDEIKSLGYNIEYIWENDWNQLSFSVMQIET